jgi:hypothetical protein
MKALSQTTFHSLAVNTTAPKRTCPQGWAQCKLSAHPLLFCLPFLTHNRLRFKGLDLSVQEGVLRQWVIPALRLRTCGWLHSHTAVRAAFFSLSFCFCFEGLGFELRASRLQSRCCTTWATPPVHFALVLLEMGVSWTIFLGWPQTEILPILASQVARITGVSHWHLDRAALLVGGFICV